jgi:hypothetical protein
LPAEVQIQTITAAILPAMATSQLNLHHQVLQIKESELQQSKEFTFFSLAS